MYGSHFVKIFTHVYGNDIITVDQGRCEKWGMKLRKEVTNPRCLSYSIRNPAGMKRRLGNRGGGGCCEVGGGGGDGGEVIGGVGVVCGDGVDSGVGGVVYGVVCQGTDIHDDLKIPEKDRWRVSKAKAEAATCKGYRSPVLSQRRKDQSINFNNDDFGHESNEDDDKKNVNKRKRKPSGGIRNEKVECWKYFDSKMEQSDGPGGPHLDPGSIWSILLF
nr:hypothetical protein [Tanacetum cinerariifolium]